MKIKTWLLVSYLIVMLLPLLAAYGLFVWVLYHQEKDVKKILKNGSNCKNNRCCGKSGFVRMGQSYEQLDELTGPRTEITLYLKEGTLLYTSNPTMTLKEIYTPKQLYKTYMKLNKRIMHIRTGACIGRERDDRSLRNQAFPG